MHSRDGPRAPSCDGFLAWGGLLTRTAGCMQISGAPALRSSFLSGILAANSSCLGLQQVPHSLQRDLQDLPGFPFSRWSLETPNSKLGHRRSSLVSPLGDHCPTLSVVCLNNVFSYIFLVIYISDSVCQGQCESSPHYSAFT